jgi:hypothetical protein
MRRIGFKTVSSLLRGPVVGNKKLVNNFTLDVCQFISRFLQFLGRLPDPICDFADDL